MGGDRADPLAVAPVQLPATVFAMQHFPLIGNTFEQSIAVLHPNNGDRVNMVSSNAEIIVSLFAHFERFDMRIIFSAALLAAGFTLTLPIIQAEASCRDTGTCAGASKVSKAVKTAPKAKARHAARNQIRRVAVHKPQPRLAKASYRGGGAVVAMIKSMAPAHGVPVWFALRIAEVESNYNPRARGRAGELGVFQLKCSTAKGIGYRGNCSGLLDARTNIQYGLKHLSLAMRSSGGDLKLAASKHNGGLGRKTMVYGYVAKIF